MNVEARDSRLIPEAPQSPKQGRPRFSRLVSAVETGIDAPGAFGRHMDQNQRTPRSAFYEPKFHRGPKHKRATGPGSYSEFDIKVGEILDCAVGVYSGQPVTWRGGHVSVPCLNIIFTDYSGARRSAESALKYDRYLHAKH